MTLNQTWETKKTIRSIPSDRLDRIINEINTNTVQNVIVSKVTEVDEDTVEVEFVPEKKFKNSDVIEFLKIKPMQQQSDEELSRVDTCPYCDKLVEPNSYIAINGKRICRNCIDDLKQQLKDEIVNRRK